jgi:hypothetical protein
VSGPGPDAGGPDPGAGRRPPLRELDPAPLVVGGFVGLAGLLFLAEPVVDPVEVAGLRLPMFALSAVALVVGLDLGAVVFLVRGNRLVGLAHGVAGGGFTLFLLGGVLGSGILLLAGVLVVGGGALALAAESRRHR